MITFWALGYMRCCNTIERWYADWLSTFTLNCHSLFRYFDCTVVVLVHLDQLQVHTEHSICEISDPQCSWRKLWFYKKDRLRVHWSIGEIVSCPRGITVCPSFVPGPRQWCGLYMDVRKRKSCQVQTLNPNYLKGILVTAWLDHCCNVHYKAGASAKIFARASRTKKLHRWKGSTRSDVP